MKYSFLLSFALGAGWLLSPEALFIAGNSAGKMGWMTFPVLAVAALLFGLSGNLLTHQQLLAKTGNDYLLIRNMTGTIPAIALTLASSIPLVILAATALLVTSGYTFNEVFLYWFPNFGFSFLLLTLLTLLQLFPKKTIFLAQIFFITLAAGGLLFLALWGMAGADKPVTEVFRQPGSFSSASSAILLILFTGSTLNGTTKRPLLVPIIGFAILSLWIFTSLSYVNPERLTSSTVPYMTAARRVMGEPGRQIMGMVTISGSCAAITTLMLLCRRMLADIVITENGAGLLSVKKQRWLFPPLVAIVTSLLMAGGLAGDELLEVLLRGALILWLMHHTLLCFSALFMIRQKDQSMPLPGATSTAILMVALFTLLLSNPHRNEMILFILSMLGIGCLFATIWFYITNKAVTQTTP